MGLNINMKALWEMRISSPHDLIKFNVPSDKATEEASWEGRVVVVYRMDL